MTDLAPVQITALWEVLDRIDKLRGRRRPPDERARDPAPVSEAAVTPVSEAAVNQAVGFARAVWRRGVELPDLVAATYSGGVHLAWSDPAGSREPRIAVTIFQSGSVKVRASGSLSGNTDDALWSIMALSRLIRRPLFEGPPTEEEHP